MYLRLEMNLNSAKNRLNLKFSKLLINVLKVKHDHQLQLLIEMLSNDKQ